MTKANNKTVATEKSVASYLKTLTPEDRSEAEHLIEIFKSVTKSKPVLWGQSIIGFGSYHYIYPSGREGDSLATGFAIRKSGPTIYIMPGYQDYSQILKTLGNYKLGKACLYIKSLQDIHIPTLKKLICVGLADLKKTYLVSM